MSIAVFCFHEIPKSCLLISTPVCFVAIYNDVSTMGKSVDLPLNQMSVDIVVDSKHRKIHRRGR